MVIRENVQMTIQILASNDIVDSGSQIAIQSSTDKIKALEQSINLITNIVALANTVRNIQFTYWNR